MWKMVIKQTTLMPGVGGLNNAEILDEIGRYSLRIEELEKQIKHNILKLFIGREYTIVCENLEQVVTV